MKTYCILPALFFLALPLFAQSQQPEPRDTTLTLLRMKNPEILFEKPIVIALHPCERLALRCIPIAT